MKTNNPLIVNVLLHFLLIFCNIRLDIGGFFLTYNPVDKCWHNKHLDKKGLFTLSILIKTYPDLPKPYLKKLIRIISLFTVKKKKE